MSCGVSIPDSCDELCDSCISLTLDRNEDPSITPLEAINRLKRWRAGEDDPVYDGICSVPELGTEMIGEWIIDNIMDGNLVRVEVDYANRATFVWSANASTQIGKTAIDAVGKHPLIRKLVHAVQTLKSPHLS